MKEERLLQLIASSKVLEVVTITHKELLEIAECRIQVKTFYPDIVDRYLGYLKNSPELGTGKTKTSHLIWMLESIRDNSEMSLTKKHRWLGYIQGIMVSHGILDVVEERDSTREIFRGL